MQSVKDILIDENDGSFFWLIMPPESHARDVVVELDKIQYGEIVGWEFKSYRRMYTHVSMQSLISDGASLHKIQKPNTVNTDGSDEAQSENL